MSEYCHNCKNLADEIAALTRKLAVAERALELMRNEIYYLNTNGKLADIVLKNAKQKAEKEIPK